MKYKKNPKPLMCQGLPPFPAEKSERTVGSWQNDIQAKVGFQVI